MQTQQGLRGYRDALGGLLVTNRPAIVAELPIVLLLPALWGFLPVPGTILPVLLLAWLSLRLRRLACPGPIAGRSSCWLAWGRVD